MQSTNTNVQGVQVGQLAPDFTLEDENGNRITLSELRGQPVVLIFYPFDWSGICTKEMCTIRDNYNLWQATGARVFGISRDSKYSHRAWKEHLGLGYSLLADLRGDVARLYGAWNEQAYRADRMTVVIDPEGIVRYVIHNDAGTMRDMGEALRAVREIASALAPAHAPTGDATE
jgi:peroxiredoxin